jgi:hypothetical protein
MILIEGGLSMDDLYLEKMKDLARELHAPKEAQRKPRQPLDIHVSLASLSSQSKKLQTQ